MQQSSQKVCVWDTIIIHYSLFLGTEGSVRLEEYSTDAC